MHTHTHTHTHSMPPTHTQALTHSSHITHDLFPLLANKLSKYSPSHLQYVCISVHIPSPGLLQPPPHTSCPACPDIDISLSSDTPNGGRKCYATSVRNKSLCRSTTGLEPRANLVMKTRIIIELPSFSPPVGQLAAPAISINFDVHPLIACQIPLALVSAEFSLIPQPTPPRVGGGRERGRGWGRSQVTLNVDKRLRPTCWSAITISEVPLNLCTLILA